MGNSEPESHADSQTDPDYCRIHRTVVDDVKAKTDVLLYRYEHLNNAHYQHNQVIHTTFYLSVVFFAGFLSIIFTVNSRGTFIPLISMFSSIIFVLLGIWAWRYNRGREEIKKRQRIIKEEMGRFDFDLRNRRRIEDTFFVEHQHSVDKYKKIWHTAYYVILSVLCFVIPAMVL